METWDQGAEQADCWSKPSSPWDPTARNLNLERRQVICPSSDVPPVGQRLDSKWLLNVQAASQTYSAAYHVS